MSENKSFNFKFRIINISVALYVLLFSVLLIFVFIGGKYSISNGGDMFDRAFGKTWLELIKNNFLYLNGRWGQAITNDFRFFEYRTATILFINLVLLFGSYYFIRFFTGRKNSIILSIATTITFSLVAYNYYYHAIYLPTANSYTVGFSLSLICFGLILRVLNKEEGKRKNLYLVLASIIILLTSALVELVSLPIMYVLGVSLLFYLVFEKKIKIRLLILFLVSVVGFLILFFSPGNTQRRLKAQNNHIVETLPNKAQDSLTKIDFFVKKNEAIIFNDFNKYNLTLFFLALFIFLQSSSSNNSLNAKKKGFIIIFTVVYALIPNIIGFLANYTGMAKIYNMHTKHFVFLVLIFAFLISNSFRSVKLLNDKRINTIVTLGCFILFLYYFTGDNNLGNFFKSVSNNQPQEVYVQEKSRRYYLIENISKKKKQVIPDFEDKYKDAFNYNSFLNRRMPLSYETTFNNKKPVFSALLGISANTYYALSNIEAYNIPPSGEIEDISFYFIKEFNTLVLSNKGEEEDFDYVIKAHYKTPFQSLTKTIYGSYNEQKLDNKHYYENKNLIGINLPFKTYKLELTIGHGVTRVIDNSIELNDSKIKEFEGNTRFSIMN
ncbi:DUF6056 family protein [Idiomarina abyssalis]|uniref:DUF6056 family protein n=1 Tax=Idiomarina abyssalis TaxID=86102 RepID=UPI003A8CCF55